MTELSENARRAVLRAESEEAWLVLLTITHPELAVSGGVIRVSTEGVAVDENGLEYVDHNGDRFYACGFEFDLPSDTEGETPQARIKIDNIGNVMVDGVEVNILHELRRITSAPTIAAKIVLASDPDIVEHDLDEMTLSDVKGSAIEISGRLTYEDTLNQAFPREAYTPSTFPGLFS